MLSETKIICLDFFLKCYIVKIILISFNCFSEYMSILRRVAPDGCMGFVLGPGFLVGFLVFSNLLRKIKMVALL